MSKNIRAQGWKDYISGQTRMSKKQIKSRMLAALRKHEFQAPMAKGKA